MLVHVPLAIDLELDSSALLRASMDERFFRVWEFAHEGAYPRHRLHKEEFEARVAAILETATEHELRELARRDRFLRQGSTFRGPEPFDPETGDLRVVAIRQLELDARHPAKTEDIALPVGLSIEHVLPQSWDEHWPLPEGANTEQLRP